MKVLSLFDGMACGMLAMKAAGFAVERYVAYEIDNYAIQTATHNFPMIEQMGDVFDADFTAFRGFDYLIGGSPCTYWSIAQKNDRETEASGIGWELFCQYVRALREAHPRYFIYENNKSISLAIKTSISKAFGFDPVYINSSLVSAQRRQRLYWVGKRNKDGTYSRVNVPEPNDRKIYLEQILTNEDFADYRGGAMVRERPCLVSYHDDTYRVGVTGKSGGQAVRVYDIKGKSVTLQSQAGGGGAKTGLYLVDGQVKSLSRTGAMKMQTVPLWYEFPCSDQQAITLLGNGWTVDVIAHILSYLKDDNPIDSPVTFGEIVLALRKFAENESDEYKHLIFTTAADKIAEQWAGDANG